MSNTATARAIPVDEPVFDEVAAIQVATDNATAAVMMIDRDFKITYVNQSTRDLLSSNTELFRKAWPTIDLSKIIGACIDGFHKDPAHQRRLLASPLSAPHTAEITIGDMRFALRINSVIDKGGDYVGNVLEWANVTEMRRSTGMLSAMSKAQAMIEFGLDGVVHDANQNFCETLGYSLDEIRGKHHSMFVDPAEVAAPAYKDFWSKLARGEFEATQYKRIAKGGREVWIQASYNPILDGSGKPFRVVEFATDITADKLRSADFEGQLAAISKSQAIIEFNLDGSIISANSNFCSALGYSPDEIKGQHHRLFIDPEEQGSSAYRAFWEKLGRGEYDAGQYKRIAKGGREIWIQASYNPIHDMNGKPYKVVKYATDITTQRRVAERAKEIANIVSAASSEMRATAEQLSSTAEEATKQAAAVASAAQVASSNVQTVSAAGEELSASIAEIARQVAESTNITQQAVIETDNTKMAIQTLAEAAKKIGNVVTLINNIAGQTKLLALNATIEAARAGDAGKGFAVVASEVKSLSDQTAKATHEISSEVSAMQAATSTSVSAIQGIAETIAKVSQIATAIASAVEEQSAATSEIASNVTEAAGSTQEVSDNIAGLNEGVSQTSAASAQLLTAAGELAVQSESLSGEMDRLLA